MIETGTPSEEEVFMNTVSFGSARKFSASSWGSWPIRVTDSLIWSSSNSPLRSSTCSAFAPPMWYQCKSTPRRSACAIPRAPRSNRFTGAKEERETIFSLPVFSRCTSGRGRVPSRWMLIAARIESPMSLESTSFAFFEMGKAASKCLPKNDLAGRYPNGAWS